MTRSTTVTRAQMEAALVQKCWKEPAFLQGILHDPKRTIEKYTGSSLPPQVKIVVHQEDASTLHLTIPAVPLTAGQLSDEELERVAGGTETVVLFSIAMASVVGTAASVSYGGSQGW